VETWINSAQRSLMCDGGFPLLFILKYEEKLEVDPPLVDD